MRFLQKLVRHGHRIHAGGSDIWEGVKRAFDQRAVDALDPVEAVRHGVATSVPSGHHVADEILRSVDRCDSARLDKRGCVCHRMTLDLGDFIDQGFRPGDITKTPPSHRVGLGKAVVGQGSFPHARFSGEAVVGVLVVDDLFVHLVSVNEKIMFLGKRAEGIDLIAVENAPGRIVGGVDDDAARIRRHGSLKNLPGNAKAIVGIEWDPHCPSTGEFDHRCVGDPGRFEQEDIDPFLRGCHHRREESLFTSGGDDDFVGLVVESVVLFEFRGDRFFQGWRAVAGDIVRVTGVHCGGGSVTDVLRRDEIRVATTKVDDIDTGRLECTGFVGNGQGWRWRGFDNAVSQKTGKVEVLRLHSQLRWRGLLPVKMVKYPATPCGCRVKTAAAS